MKTLVLLSGLLCSLVIYAQDPQLLNNQWFLEHIVIDGISFTPPSNDEVPFVGIYFNTDDMFDTNVCNTFQANLAFHPSEQSFEILDGGITLIMCNNPDNNIFENRYFQDFFDAIFNLDNPFEYEINLGSGDDKQLIITSAAGNTATYNNFQLSVLEQKLADFKIFPNPATETLSIVSDQFAISEIAVYNVHGANIVALEVANMKTAVVDVRTLPSGIYFVQITSEDEQRQTLRFIKQ